LWLAAGAAAQPASDLLQSAIFAQETAGDLDGAIRIYRQILASNSDMRLYAPQAQYRLGICLLRKGDITGAAEALQAVIRNYPGERELVDRARESLPRAGELLPAPWPATEVAEYRWTIPHVDDGWSLTRIAPGAAANSLRIQMNFYSPRLYSTLVDVDRANMRPMRAAYRPPSEPLLNGRWQGVRVLPGSAGLAAYQYGELLYLLRRMLLYSGWKATIPVAGPNGSLVELNASVTAQETVTVPAGTFKCFKVRLATDPKVTPPKYSAVGADWQVFGPGQSLWYAVDGTRPLVKMQVAELTGELTSLRTGEQMGTTSFRDPVIGYSFTVPAGWMYHSRTASGGPATSVDLLDPELQVFVTISCKSKKTAPENIEEELVTGALNEQNLRPGLETKGAIEHGQIGGHRCVTWIGERTGPEGKVVRWTTWIQSESTRASFAVAMPAEDFERFRARFQAILNSFRMP